MKKWCLVVLTMCILAGCGVQTQDEERLSDLEFTVLAPENIPEELRNVLEEKKASPFKVTYEDEGYRIWRTADQRLQYCCGGPVSDQQCSLCGYGASGSRERRRDGGGDDLSIYGTEAAGH